MSEIAMEKVNNQESYNSWTKTCNEVNQLEPFLAIPKEQYSSKEFEKNDDLKKSTNVGSEINYKLFIEEMFNVKGFIANENWEKTINVDSKIIQSNKDIVICECLIDRENNIFEKMSFPRHIFSHIASFKTNPYVVLSIKSKMGSTRIDVIKGEGLVDKKRFEFIEEWEEIKDEDFNQPLKQPLKL